MNRLFTELYLDEDVAILVAELLHAHGFSAVTAREAGLLGKDDVAQLTYAVSQARAILTHNRADFEDLAKDYFAAGKMHYGIIVARRRTPFEVVRRLLPILDNVTADEMQSQLRYI